MITIKFADLSCDFAILDRFNQTIGGDWFRVKRIEITLKTK